MNDAVSVLHASLINGLSTLPGVTHCSATPARRDAIRLPAILIELVELEPDVDPGTGQLQLRSHWEARVIVNDNQPESLLWGLVQTLMRWLFDYHFPDENIGRAKLKQASPDHFSPEWQGHRIWLVEWEQVLRIGDDVWHGSGTAPTSVLVNGLSAITEKLEP